MKVNGKMIKEMVLVFRSHFIKGSTKDNGLMMNQKNIILEFWILSN